jgi:hypothetical protein
MCIIARFIMPLGILLNLFAVVEVILFFEIVKFIFSGKKKPFELRRAFNICEFNFMQMMTATFGLPRIYNTSYGTLN